MTAQGPEWRIRRPAVAGTFYPSVPARLESLVRGQLEEAAKAAGDLGAAAALGGVRGAPTGAAAGSGRPIGAAGERLLGLLVPHAGLVYSGLVAAAAWRLLGEAATGSVTVVLLGTNHGAGWLDGVGVWDSGTWLTPLGHVEVDEGMARRILDLGAPFVLDRAAHLDEHSIEVQLPFLQLVAPEARIVPLAVSTGIDDDAIAAGRRLGEFLGGVAREDGTGKATFMVVSSDMAHYPPADVCAAATKSLLPSIVALDPARLAASEVALRRAGVRGLVCGMCGIEPAVLGLAAFAAMGAIVAEPVMAATSADAGGSPDRTVGYLSAAFGR